MRMPDQLLIFSEAVLYHVIKQCVAYFNRARPHQGLGQKIPEATTVGERVEPEGKIIAFPVPSELHHDYRRTA
jgi:putative transposase